MPKTVLILSGPTHEYIDPVRFIGNASSGRMGRSLAIEALSRGYDVQFISGPVASANLPPDNSHIRQYHVTSAGEMLAEARTLFSQADIVIFAAAVADYTPKEKMQEKMGKSPDELLLHLRPTPDIAKTLCAGKRPDQVAFGFALQTSDGIAHARRKLEGKNLDGIILNTPASLNAPDGTFSLLQRSPNSITNWGCIDKAQCARNIFDAIEHYESNHQSRES